MSDLYKVGGALPLNAPSYICRQADHDLYEGLLAGEFCYVLNSRQMGKSSLRVQTRQRLQEAGVACATIDITKIGSQGITPEEWYAGLLFTLINQLQLPLTLQQFETWWEDHRLFSPVNRFSEFIDKLLLEEISGRIVIFIDEIDSILQLNFKDDFFAAIRAYYNRRAENPEYNRLTFVLLGVATPSNLIQDKKRTPFNVGRSIQLNGFEFEEARPLAQGLADKAANSELVLHNILYWTGGQPFLTQKLCQLILTLNSSIPEGEEAIWVESLVQILVIENWESQDEPEHLRTIRDRLLHAEDPPSITLLRLYQRILNQGELLAEDDNVWQLTLRLTGLIVKRDRSLQVSNPIYAKVFDQEWLDSLIAKISGSASSGHLHLLILEDDRGRRECVLNGPVYSIGRDPKCDIRLFSQFVSRRHATLVQLLNEDGTYYYRIVDGNPKGELSSNGLLINGRKLHAQDLRNEDEIIFGSQIRAIYYLLDQDGDDEVPTLAPDEFDITLVPPNMVGLLEDELVIEEKETITYDRNEQSE